MKNLLMLVLAAGIPCAAEAKLNVVTTISDLAAVAKEVAGGDAEVESIAKGTQDPHFIEAKPSYMVKVSRADLLVAVGLELEIGWLPPLVQGARNPQVNRGQKGYLELGPLLEPLEVARGELTRAQGDVHPEGNPHFWLDPIRLGRAAVIIGEKMGELDPPHKADYERRARAIADRMQTKTEQWKKRINQSGVKRVVTYHKTLTYFFDRFGLENSAYLEPKPGIPPTSGHLIEVIQVMKQRKVTLVLVENFFDVSVTKKLTGEVLGSRAVSVAVSVGGEDRITSSDELYEQLVRAIEGK